MRRWHTTKDENGYFQRILYVDGQSNLATLPPFASKPARKQERSTPPELLRSRDERSEAVVHSLIPPLAERGIADGRWQE